MRIERECIQRGFPGGVSGEEPACLSRATKTGLMEPDSSKESLVSIPFSSLLMNPCGGSESMDLGDQ